MRVQVVGIQKCDFKDEQGNHIVGLSLKCLKEPKETTTFSGQDICKVFLTPELQNEAVYVPAVGDFVNLDYDIDGRRSYLVGYSQA